MTRVWHRSSAGVSRSLLVLAIASAGCSGKKVGVGEPGVDGGSGAGQLILVRVGQGALLVHPNDPVTIQASLSLTGHGPETGQPVTFKMTQQPGQISLSATQINTDENGLATINVTCIDTGEFAMRADSPGATSTAVWKLDCEPVVELLSVVPSSQIEALDPPQDTMAAATVSAGSVIPLTVLVQEEGLASNGSSTLIPLPNQAVTFTLASEAGNAGFSGNSTLTVQTITNGTATAQLTVGSSTGVDVVSVSLANAAAPPVTFSVTIQPGCMSDADCNGGVCNLTNHSCSSSSGGGATMCGTNDVGCPVGYTCTSSGACAPVTLSGCSSCPEGSDGGYTCNTATMMCEANTPQCMTNADCPNGMCQNGVCYNNSGSVIDVTGHWYTEHIFDVEQALPGWLQISSTAIRTIDQVLLGQLGLPSWVDAIIRGIVQQFIPQWVQSLVYLLDNLLTLFNNLQASGEMDLSAIGGNLALISGNETWTTFDFYLLAQCGQNIGGNPSQPPPCALFNVYTSTLPVDLAVTVNPFTAAVQGGNGSPYILQVDPRTVSMSFAGLILYVVDQAVQIITGYPSLTGPPGDPQDGALYNLVDCPDLAAQIMSIIPIDVTGLCEAAVEAIANVIAQQLQSIVVEDNDLLEFSGHATATANPSDPAYQGPNYATDLGTLCPSWPGSLCSPQDGLWNGNFSIIGTISNVPGGWFASREPIPPM